MRFHEFGDCNKQKMILIHGILTPWQLWKPMIDYFSKDYYVIVPALDGHVEEEESEFESIEDEARQMEEYYISKYGREVFAVCGISIGGAIAHVLWKNQRIRIHNLVLDGAPLVTSNAMVTKVMTRKYLDLVHKSKERDAVTLEECRNTFLPEEYMESYLKFIDRMEDSTIINIIRSVSQSRLDRNIHAETTNVLYSYGTEDQDIASKRSAFQLVTYYPYTLLVCFKGCGQCYKAIYKPTEWIDMVDRFVS